LKAAYVDTSCLVTIDLWHLSTAIYVTSDPGDLTSLTLDGRQAEVAEVLGFRA